MNWLIVSLALLAGFSCGVVFRWLKLPIPAPPALAGIVGIIGIYLGYLLVEYIKTGKIVW